MCWNWNVNSDIAFGGFYLQCLPAGYSMWSAELLIDAAMGSQWCASIKQGGCNSGVGWRWLQEEETKNKRGWRLRVLGFSSCVVWIVLGLLQLFGGTWVKLIWTEMCQTIIHLYFPWLSHIVYDLWGTFHMPLHVWHQLSQHWLMQCNWLNVKEQEFYGLWKIFNILLRGSRIGDQGSLYIELWCVFYPWSAIWTLQNVNKLWMLY